MAFIARMWGILSPVDGLWRYFQSWTIRNKALVNVHAQIFVWTCFFFLVGKYWGVELLIHKVSLLLKVYKKVSNAFLKWLDLVIFPWVICVFCLLLVLLTIGNARLRDFSCSNESYCYHNLHFLNDLQLWVLAVDSIFISSLVKGSFDFSIFYPL